MQLQPLSTKICEYYKALPTWLCCGVPTLFFSKTAIGSYKCIADRLLAVASIFLTLGVIPVMHIIIHLSNIFNEWIGILVPPLIWFLISCVKIFYHVNSTIRQQWEQYLKLSPYVLWKMAPIVKNYINTSHFLYHTFQKFCIVLWAYTNLSMFSVRVHTSWVNINAKYSSIWTKVRPPYC